jgi:hypothetical protein
MVEKKSRNGSTWVENPAALGNCIVAIEVAQAVGMSIAAVMQNANVIEGRLTWSGKFVIAAVNASHRFSPLEFELVNKGMIKASYREKLGWNDNKRGFDFEERTVEIENWECRAWAMVMQNGRMTEKRVQGPRVSMKMAVEEGWYAKSGSKWQTEMFELMLMYRAGSFFGNIHAPDVIMGMGRITEEVEDITTVDVNAAGQVTAVTTDELRRHAGTKTQDAEVVTQKNSVESHAEETPSARESAKPVDAEVPAVDAGLSVLTYAEVADAIVKATTTIEHDAARALIPRVVDAMQQAELNAKSDARFNEITKSAAVKAEPTSRRAKASPNPSME